MVYQASAPPQPKRLIKRTTGGVETNPAQTSSKQKIDQAEFNRQIIASGEAQLLQGNLKKKDVERIRLEIAQAKRELQRGTRDYSSVQNKQTTSTPAPLPTAEESAAGQSFVGGYSSVQQNASYEPLKPVPASNIYGTKTYISSKGKTAIQIPATPVQQNSILYSETEIKQPIKKTEVQLTRKDLSSQEKITPEKEFARNLKKYKYNLNNIYKPTQEDFSRQEAFFTKFKEGIEKFRNEPTTPGGRDNIAAGAASGLVGASEMLLGSTPLYYGGKYKTFKDLGEYGYQLTVPLDVGFAIGSTAYKTPPIPFFGRVARTGQELGEYVKKEGIGYSAASFYSGGRGIGFFTEPIETFSNTKYNRLLSKIEGVDYLDKIYKLEETKKTGQEFNQLVVREIKTGRFAPTKKVPIEFIPAQTIGQSIKSLKSNIGKTVPTIHVSEVGKFKFGSPLENLFKKNPETVLTALPEKLSGTRAQLELTGFYESSPNPKTGQARAYLGYAGINGRIQIRAPSDYGFRILPKKVKPLALFQKTRILSTPKIKTPFDIPKKFKGLEKSTIQIIGKQERIPGGTFAAAEDLSGLAPFGIEGQYVTPTRYAGEYKTGRPPALGARSQKVRELGNRYFFQKVEPPILGFLATKSKFVKGVLDTDFYTRAYQIKLTEVKKIPGLPFTEKELAQANKKYELEDKLGSELTFTTKKTTKTSIKESLPRNDYELSPETFSYSPYYRLRENTNTRYDFPLTQRITKRREETVSIPFLRERRIIGRESRRDYSLRFNEAPRSLRRNESRRSSDNRFRFDRTTIFPRETREPISRQDEYRFREVPRIGRGSDRRRPGEPRIPRTPSNPSQPRRGKERRSLFSRLAPYSSLGFSVLTRRRGKVINLNQNLTQSDAFAFGTNVVRNTARASFRLIPTNTYAVPKGLSASNVSLKQSKGFFVQQRGTRIGSIGEKLELRAARRNKR